MTKCIIVSLILYFFLVDPVFSETCPGNMWIGKISSITKHKQNVKILIKRNNSLIEAVENDCLIYNDTVEVPPGAEAELDVPEGVIKIGDKKILKKWKAPSSSSFDEALTTASSFQIIFKAFFSDKKTMTYRISRSEGASCSGYSTQFSPIEALQYLPSGHQIIGADLASIMLAWKAGSALEKARVAIYAESGRLAYKEEICQTNAQAIQIPDNLRIPGTTYRIEIEDEHGGKLQWEMNVVDGDSLPSPTALPASQRVLGAWRLTSTGQEYRLDSLSRLAIDDSPLMYPRLLFQAVLRDEKMY